MYRFAANLEYNVRLFTKMQNFFVISRIKKSFRCEAGGKGSEIYFVTDSS